jgi:two-component system chemotaxis response regulator CheY
LTANGRRIPKRPFITITVIVRRTAMPAKHTVLIVDDSHFVARLMGRMLDGTSFTVVGHAKNGEEAIELFQQHRPEIVTMDIVMPTMGGIETITRLNALDENANILVVSAMGHEDIVQQAMKAGAKHYIFKPFQKEDFLKAMEYVKVGA